MGSEVLNLFPSRVPIGRVTDDRGVSRDVMMSADFARALAGLMVRVGGGTALSNTELADLIGSMSSEAAMVTELRQQVEELTMRLAAADQMVARVAALEKLLRTVEQKVHGEGPVPVDWEHPGHIGAASANSGQFTTLSATNKVQLNPKDQPVEIKPTGTALVTIKPAAIGQVDNVELGKTVPQIARVLNINKVIIVEPATSAYIQIADGKGIGVNRSIILTASADGVTLNIAGGGTLGTAAFRNGGALTEDWNAATLKCSQGFSCNGADPQGKQNSGGTLAGVIQALKNNGILSA